MLRHLSPSAKLALRKFARSFGLDVRINGLNSREDLRFTHFLKLHRIDTLLDIGANRGQFAQGLLDAGFGGRVISFEPLPAANEHLAKVAAPYGDRWHVARPVALSDHAGTAKFFVTSRDTSSSLLEPLNEFVEASPVAEVSEYIKVETARLDDLYPDLNLKSSRTFLKLDVQGGEDRVLKGAARTLSEIKGALIELSFAKLYDHQASALGIQQLMFESGFSVWDIWRGYSNPKNYRLNQVDALFFRDGPEGGA